MIIIETIKRRARGNWHAVQSRAAELYDMQVSGLWSYENCVDRAYRQICKGKV